jgi:hypothetical protein
MLLGAVTIHRYSHPGATPPPVRNIRRGGLRDRCRTRLADLRHRERIRSASRRTATSRTVGSDICAGEGCSVTRIGISRGRFGAVITLPTVWPTDRHGPATVSQPIADRSEAVTSGEMKSLACRRAGLNRMSTVVAFTDIRLSRAADTAGLPRGEHRLSRFSADTSQERKGWRGQSPSAGLHPVIGQRIELGVCPCVSAAHVHLTSWYRFWRRGSSGARCRGRNHRFDDLEQLVEP